MSRRIITEVNGQTLERFLLEVKNHIAILTLNNPPINLIDEVFEQELINICNYINSDYDIWVCVMISEGKTFTAGVDINLFNKSIIEHTLSDTQDKYYDGALALYELKVPLICAIHGYCLGGGLCYMAGSDIVIAAENTIIGLPEVDICVIGGSGHLSRIVPPHIMREMALTGTFVTVESIERYGGINHIVQEDQLKITAINKAEELVKKGPHILRYFKECMNRQEDFQMKRKNELEVLYTRHMSKHDDFSEAVTAFLEKREPKFNSQ